MNIEDTIVAVSSPPGAAERGIVRLSGPRAVPITESLFEPNDESRLSYAQAPSHITGRLHLDRHRLPAAVCLFLAPRSYTRQDVVEIHLLGSPVLLGMVVEACLAAGARRAEPGEYTARAFLAGTLDLSQVHGIAGMIAARSDLQLQAAERLLHGVLSRTAHRAREELADLLSLVEGALDFADEPIEFIAPRELRRRLAGVREALASTSAAGLRAERWGQLPRVLLLGLPNVGKSSLMNRLSGLDRAICAPIAGTTRDVLSAPLVLGETECLLVDVAGLAINDDTLDSGRNDPNTPDAQAQLAALRARTEADLVLYVMDLTTNDSVATGCDPDPSGVPFIVVANKCDLLSDDQAAGRVNSLAEGLTPHGRVTWPSGRWHAQAKRGHADRPEGAATCQPRAERNGASRLSAALGQHDQNAPSPERAVQPSDHATGSHGQAVCLTSALTGEGCDLLKDLIEAALRDRPVHADEPAIALMAEHRSALQDAIDALDRAIGLVEIPGNSAPEAGDALRDVDLVAAELHITANALAVLVGQDQTEDLLGRIFARFCVGK
ncbi:MAG: GTPase [Phycisphaerae bacterium]